MGEASPETYKKLYLFVKFYLYSSKMVYLRKIANSLKLTGGKLLTEFSLFPAIFIIFRFSN